jgi:thiol-disulfide isomerase/thioredoxin
MRKQNFAINELHCKWTAPIVHKYAEENEKVIKNYQKIIYQFHYKDEEAGMT